MHRNELESSSNSWFKHKKVPQPPHQLSHLPYELLRKIPHPITRSDDCPRVTKAGETCSDATSEGFRSSFCSLQSSG